LIQNNKNRHSERPYSKIQELLQQSRTLDDQSAGTANDKRWMICAHYLLARLYTTCPMAELHSVTKAIEHGTSACELSGWGEPICLDALAGAYGEAGRFDLAVKKELVDKARQASSRAMERIFVAHSLRARSEGLKQEKPPTITD
jgi:hypothetical protein